MVFEVIPSMKDNTVILTVIPDRDFYPDESEKYKIEYKAEDLLCNILTDAGIDKYINETIFNDRTWESTRGKWGDMSYRIVFGDLYICFRGPNGGTRGSDFRVLTEKQISRDFRNKYPDLAKRKSLN